MSLDYAQLYLINGRADGQISAHDRGLMFADGVFETLLFKHSEYRHLDLHLERLASACERLHIQCDGDRVEQDLASFQTLLCERGIESAVVKLIVTRGQSQTAYRYSGELTANIYLTVRPWRASDIGKTGARVRRCRQTLAAQPSLAGLKHLAKIEYVLARNEWGDEFDEGLLFDAQGHLIEATSANVFVVKSGVVYSPMLDNAGVEGVMKQRVVALCRNLEIDCVKKSLTESDILAADEVFISNAVIGLWPLASYKGDSGAVDFTAWPVCRRLQAALL